MRRYVIVSLAMFAALLYGVGVYGSIVSHGASKPDPYLQRNFPCQEDEALMFAPRFGPDKVGCVPIDEIEAALP